MKNFKTVDEERKFWLELAHSPFWATIQEMLNQREAELFKMLADETVPRDNDARITGRLVELRWLKDLPLQLLNTAALTSLVEEEPKKEEVSQRLVGKPDSTTGIL